MKKMYFKHAALALGIVACAGSASADWSNVNGLYLKAPSFVPGWSGALAKVENGVGEVWNGAFEVYQVINDAPAGHYKLTCNAFYRYAGNNLAMENMKNGENHFAYIFLGTAEKPVVGLFDNGQILHEGDYNVETMAPNGLDTAEKAFAAGKYANEIEFDHKGGDLKLGIKNLGSRQDEWCAFDNFKLVGPSGDVALVNGDFSEGFPTYVKKNPAYGAWDLDQIANDPKSPDVNKDGGVYRKTNASPYNFGQRIELPAGKYRFGVQSFLRYGGAGNVAGKYITCKGQWGWVEDTSALDRHNSGDETQHAYLYVTDGWDLADDDVTEIKPVDKDGATWGNEKCFYKEQQIKCIFDEDLTTYPDNLPATDQVDEFGYGWCDSGSEYQAAKFFVNNPDKYRNYIEFELTAPAKVWVGLKKDENGPVQYWNPFRDFTIEKYVEGGSGVAEIVVDENAPVEYYNLQGIRVANPENGLYIVKQGNKVTKRVIK